MINFLGLTEIINEILSSSVDLSSICVLVSAALVWILPSSFAVLTG